MYDCPENDDIPHFFCRCAKIKPFWDALFNWTKQFLDLSLAHLSENEVLLGLLLRQHQQEVINWMLMQAKFYIVQTRLGWNFWPKSGRNCT